MAIKIPGLQKSKNVQAGRYLYRGCYIQKTFHTGHWHVRCAELGVEIPKGINARTLRLITKAIDQELDRGK